MSCKAVVALADPKGRGKTALWGRKPGLSISAWNLGHLRIGVTLERQLFAFVIIPEGLTVEGSLLITLLAHRQRQCCQ